jgi:hypothetical protein
MVQNRENDYTSSVLSTTSPGMAGAGAFRFQEQQHNEQEYYHDNAGQQQYYDANPALAGPMQRAPLQPRGQYTFGQAPAPAAAENPFIVDDYDGEAHGAYSSEPHGLDEFDHQAYGNYAFSPADGEHIAGAHTSGQHNTKSSIGSRLDDGDAYGGI